MLKIKDNVDLKELEKFGFKKKTYLDSKCLVLESTINEVHNYQDILFELPSRRLGFCNWGYDILYDLIQAGLVEKVEL